MRYRKENGYLFIEEDIENILVRPLGSDYQLRLSGPAGQGRNEVGTVLVTLSAGDMTVLVESIHNMRTKEERQAKVDAIVRLLEENEDVATPPGVIGDALLDAGFTEEAAQYHRKAKERAAREEYEAKLANIKKEFDIKRPT